MCLCIGKEAGRWPEGDIGNPPTLTHTAWMVSDDISLPVELNHLCMVFEQKGFKQQEIQQALRLPVRKQKPINENEVQGMVVYYAANVGQGAYIGETAGL